MDDGMTAPGSNQALGERFHKHFQLETSSIEKRIDQLHSRPVIGGERQDAVEHCLAAITQLSKEINEASGYLPPYDQRAYSNTIRTLTDKLSEIRSIVAPKPKFAFKSARKIKAPGSPDSPQSRASPQIGPSEAGTGSSGGQSPSAEQGDASALSTTDVPVDDVLNERLRDTTLSGPRKPSFSQTNRVVLSNHRGIHIILPSSATHATGASILRDLSHCVVDLSIPSIKGHSFAGLTLQSIQDSLVLCGQISGPIHITNVSSSIIITACRQFRMHNCRDVDVYLHCASRPIIEDCEGLRFAPLPDAYITESLRNSTNHWDQVDDFKWLKSEVNPHWSVLAEALAPAPTVWTDIVPGGPHIGVDDILTAVQTRESA